MAERGYSVRLSARVDGYVAAMKEAERASGSFADNTNRNMEKLGGQMQSVGKKMTTFVTLPLVGLGVGAAAAAVSWESAWAGVTKTVDGTAAELEALESGLRNMAKELPATHAEIAAVAEAAGQLGVGVADIEAFTRVMVDLGETTNLTSDEAATSIAQLMNVMGTSGDDVDRLGSALVALGNDGASTERQIVQMAQRMASAGKIIGLTEAEVLAFGNALASTGIEVEAGGTAMSRIMIELAKAVSTGSVQLETFAAVAGVSTEQFAAAFNDAPAEAIVSFVEGLGNINAAGGDVFSVLDNLGLADIRVSQALLNMANSGDKLTNSLETGRAAWKENAALQEEAAKRYETIGAQFGMLRNQIVDVGISLGENLMPAMRGAIGFVGGLVEGFAKLPGPLQAIIVGFLALAAAAGPVIWMAGTLIKNLSQIRTAMTAFKASSLASSGAIGALGVGLGVASAAVLAYGIQQGRAAQATQAGIDKANELSRVLDENLARTFAEAVYGFIKGGKDMEASLEAVARQNLEGAKRALEHGEALGWTADEMRMMAEAVATVEAENVQAAATTEEYSEALVVATGAAVGFAASQEEIDAAVDAVIDAAREAVEAHEELIAAMIRGVSSAFDYETAVHSLDNAYKDYEEQILETMEALNDSEVSDRDKERALRDLRLAEIGVAESSLATAEAYAREKGAADGTALSAQLQVEKLRDLQAQYPELRDEIQVYIDKLLAIPDVRDTRIRPIIEGYELAEAKLDALARNRTSTVTVITQGAGGSGSIGSGGIKGRAAGGPTLRGNIYEVGEGNKPEMLYEGGRSFLIPGNDGKVVPMSSAMGMGGAPVNVNIVVNSGSLDPEGVAEAINRQIRQSGVASLLLGRG